MASGVAKGLVPLRVEWFSNTVREGTTNARAMAAPSQARGDPVLEGDGGGGSPGTSASKTFPRAVTSGVEHRGQHRSSAFSGFAMRIRAPHPLQVTTTGPIAGYPPGRRRRILLETTVHSSLTLQPVRRKRATGSF